MTSFLKVVGWGLIVPPLIIGVGFCVVMMIKGIVETLIEMYDERSVKKWGVKSQKQIEP